ncbi:MAG: DUF4199 domain-containing protein [Flavobacteriaceae bacterium]|nr:DUF4199 domain-containing protein [Flavobacteriaceae bacterium]
MDTEKASVKKTAINYGLVLGGFLALLTVVLYAVSLESLTKWWLGIVIFLIALAVGIVSVAKSKSILGGFISFKQAFTSYFITIALGLFISVIVGILLFNFVDPEAAEVLKEQIVVMTESMMERFGAPQEEIDKAITKLEEEDSFGIGKQLQNYVFQLIFYSIFGLLVALIMKRKDKNQLPS